MAELLKHTLQEDLLTLLAHDDDAGRLIANLVEVSHFEGVYRDFAERCIKYHNDYGRAPGKEHITNLVEDVISDKHNRKREKYLNIINGMNSLIDVINKKYVMDKANTFIRQQTLVAGVMKSAELLSRKQEHSIEEVEAIWSNLLRVDHTGFSSGFRITSVDKVLEYVDAQFKEFQTGIPELDNHGSVPYRGAVMLFLASTGMGKTWWLIHLGKRALLLRKKVLHVTLEMSEEETAVRYIQNLFSVSKRAGSSQVVEIIRGKKNRVRGFDTVEVPHELAFSSPSIGLDLRVHMNAFGGRISNLLIKRFPTRGLTPDGLRRYLDTLERVDGFVPDIINLDYLGLLKTDTRDHRISLGRMFEDLRGIAVERHCALSTAHQTSRESAHAKLVTTAHVAEDWSLIGTADRAVTYSATKQERKHKLARLFVDKARSDIDKYLVLITQNYNLGQFVLDSAMLDDQYWDRVEALGTDEGVTEEEEEGDD